jgi:F-type H+-transporting ATPase subunit alpha
VERQVVSIWAGTTGALDDIPVADISRFETDLLDHIAHEHSGIYDSILETGKLEDDTISTLEQVVENFKKSFDSRDDATTVNEAEAEASAKDDEGNESVKVRKRPDPKKTS